ncbi:MAG: hypothetical protein ACTHL3_00655 [Candidatus Nitrosocosmicus sp.]
MNRVQININNVSSQTISNDGVFSKIYNSTIPLVVKVTAYNGTTQTISKSVSGFICNCNGAPTTTTIIIITVSNTVIRNNDVINGLSSGALL